LFEEETVVCTVLDILKQSEIGLTQDEFADRAKVENVPNAFVELGSLITQGYARFDENPKPGRFKATNKAWPEVHAA
jgi:hypothetical protein